jgi:hypothetical protein
VADFKVLTWNSTGWTVKEREDRMGDVSAEIQTLHLPNTNQEITDIAVLLAPRR